MKRFRVVVQIPLVLEFEGDAPTEKTVAHVATKVGVCGILKRWNNQKTGWCTITGEDPKIETISVKEMP